jgi:hypothetical protein
VTGGRGLYGPFFAKRCGGTPCPSLHAGDAVFSAILSGSFMGMTATGTFETPANAGMPELFHAACQPPAFS